MNSETPRTEASNPGRIGHYRVIRPLGRGGQGTVYLAEDLKLHREVALKLLPPGCSATAEARLRLEREAETAARVSHACVARVFEMGEHEGRAFLAMEYVAGATLAELIDEARSAGAELCRIEASSVSSDSTRDGGERPPSSGARPSSRSGGDRRSLDRLAAIFEELCRGLAVAHEKGLVHRDLKPGNIIIRPDGSPVLIDFGLAQDDDSEGVTLTQTGQMLGTLAYMPPEQVRGDRRSTDRRSDVYAMGVTLFECCTLKRPFSASSRHELMQAILNDAPRRPRSLNPRLSADLEAIILTAIDRDPKRRYQSADEMADDLGRYRRREPIRARPVGPTVRSLRWMQRNALVTATTALIFIALLSISIVLYGKNRDVSAALAREQDARRAEERERSAKERIVVENASLADSRRLQLAREAAGKLHPPDESLIPRIEAWLARFGELVDRLPVHEAALAELRARALPYDEEERLRDHATELAELERLEKQLAERLGQVGVGSDEAPAEEDARWIEAKRGEIAKLRTLMSQRRTWRFADENDRYQHDVLASLVEDLEVFARSPKGQFQIVSRRLEDCRAMLRFAREEGPAAWAECRRRIRENPVYGGLELEPRIGLVPLGADPESDLEEFLHYLTHEGPIPVRSAETGKLEYGERTGIILILVPGGTFEMGSQAAHRDDANYDPSSRPSEREVHEVTLDPYFLAKHEMTQAQWLRAFGLNPSRVTPDFHPPSLLHVPTLRHPVEQISWDDAATRLALVGLTLPTEAEWERAARAGRQDTIWSGTAAIAELAWYANMAGSEVEGRISNIRPQRGHRDDWVGHAPVGSFRPNGWGFHDMSGNVWEFCLDDARSGYDLTPGKRGLRRNPSATPNHISRGGAYADVAILARIAHRFSRGNDEHNSSQGVRPAMLLGD